MPTVILKINDEQEKMINFFKEKFKTKTRTKVMLKCLEIAYNTLSKV